jgi:hypothetical protein
MIARLRHSTPGVMLISPPPHHDIYSIEDLAQLIYDLKQINPDAKVCVKLVSRSGIGTIAAGVAKANADVILISGNVGGTGASPQTSIKFAGVPWEMGLSEANQVLTLNRLRHRVLLRTDGGLKTGRDVVIAAMLGAEEFGIGTASLIAMGCIMVRQCHSNTCPVGVCTQDPDLRAKFTGTPEKVVNLFSFVAEEVREILAQLGFRRLDDVIGRSDLLTQVSRGAPHLDDLDLNPLLVIADPGDTGRICTVEGRNPVPDTLDAQMIEDARMLFADGEKMQLTYNVRNVQRAIGTRLSSHITRKFGMTGLKPGHVTVRLRGSCGQSLGAFAVQGLKLEVFGDANDYVGKGLSGGTIVVRPMTASTLEAHRNTIIGNTVRHGGPSLRGRAGGRALRGAQLGCHGGGGGLRLQRVRVHDRRHGGHPGVGRRQLRRRHDGRHGLRLRRGGAPARAHQPRERGVAADRGRPLGDDAGRPDRGPRAGDAEPVRRAVAERLGPREGSVLAGGAEGDGEPPGGADHARGVRRGGVRGGMTLTLSLSRATGEGTLLHLHHRRMDGSRTDRSVPSPTAWEREGQGEGRRLTRPIMDPKWLPRV